MSVLIASDRNRLILLEERLARLEERFTNVHQRCQDVGEILPEALYVSTDQAALVEALQTPVECCIKHSLQHDPQNFVKALLPIFVPLLRKLLASSRKPIATVLKSQEARLKSVKQYFDSLDQTLSVQQSQLNDLVTRFNHCEEIFASPEIPRNWESSLESLARRLSQQQAQGYELQQQVADLKAVIQPLQTFWEAQHTQLTEVDHQFEKIDRVLLSHHQQLAELEKWLKGVEQLTTTQQSQLTDIDQYFNHLEKAHLNQQMQLSEVIAQVNQLMNIYKPLEESVQRQAAQVIDFEKYLNNLENAVIRHDSEFEKMSKLMANVADVNKPLQETLDRQLGRFAEFEQYLDNLEKAHVNQHWQLTQVSNQVETVTESLKPLKESVQVYHTQLATLEETLDNLEKVQVGQVLQLDNLAKQVPQLVQDSLTPIHNTLQSYRQQLTEVDQYLDGLEKAHVKQHLQLNQFSQQADELQRVQLVAQQKLTSLDDTLQTQQTHLDRVDQRVVDIEGPKMNQMVQQLKQLEKVSVRFEHLEDRINDPKKRALDLADILPDAIRQATQQLTSELTSQIKSEMGGAFQGSTSGDQGEAGSTPEGVGEGEEATSGKGGDKVTREEELAMSMQRPVELCIQQAIKKDVRPFADALFPLIGPTIRRSISELFRDLVQRINTALEQSIFSTQGIAWRIQAWRTGQSFAEIVLSHTLQYRVEQVFLIHRETGLLILHVHSEEAEMGSDRDAVSAMFTAIQDFVRDSFSASKEEELESVEVGQYTVWLERGPYAVLACVIRGEAHRSFRNLMREQMETIHARHSIFLEQFEGDNSKLKYCQPLLEELLRSELKPEAQPRWMTPQLAIIVGGIVLSISGLTYYRFEYQSRLDNYLKALHHTPGIVVTTTEMQHSKLIIYGMRDPLAEDPLEIAQRFQLNEENIIFVGKPYQDLHPQLLGQRLRLWLNPPATVQMNLQGTLLHLKGHADQAWIDKVNDRAWKLAGITDIDNHELVNTEAQFQAYLKTLNETPGIMVVSSGVKEGQRFITGMRDPLAEDPAEIAKRMQISDINGIWRPYQDLTSQFVVKRVLTRLQPPATVITRLDGDVLYLGGHASPDWINKAIESARTVPGVNQLVTDKLITVDQFLLGEAKQQITLPKNVTMTLRDRVLQVSGHLDTATFQGFHKQLEKFKKSQPELASIDSLRLIDIENEVQKFKQGIDKTVVFFAEDIDLLPKQEEVLQTLRKDFQQLLAYNQELKRPTLLQVTGNTDGLGTEKYNQELGQRRAEVIVEWLSTHDMDKELLAIVPPAKTRFGELEPNPNDRNVVFQVLTK